MDQVVFNVKRKYVELLYLFPGSRNGAACVEPIRIYDRIDRVFNSCRLFLDSIVFGVYYVIL